MALYGLTVNGYSGLMDEHRDEFPEVRLSDAFNGDGFPAWGPRTPLSDAALDDALARLNQDRYCATHERAHWDDGGEERRRAQARTRAAKEIQAAWHDPNWLDER